MDARMAVPGALRLWDHFQFERLGFFVVDKDRRVWSLAVWSLAVRRKCRAVLRASTSLSPPSLCSDFAAGRLVFNQTVTLKEDAGARKLKGAA